MKWNWKKNKSLPFQDVFGPAESTITHVTYDSRKIQENGCFVSIPGNNIDGHTFIPDAVHNGASTVVGSDRDTLTQYAASFPAVTFVLVEDSKTAMADYAAHLHHHIHKKMNLFGVTGTNGKTTVTAYIRSMLNNLGEPAGIIGTAGVWSKKSKHPFKPTTPTTPEAADLHDIFASFYEEGTRTVAMEATSIAIDLKRLHGLEFEVGVHTNLVSEHMEFHGTMENYKRAKLKLFQQSRQAVVNLDDDGMAQDILNMFGGPVWTYGIRRSADIMASNIRTDAGGSSFLLTVQGRSYLARAPVFGEYNISNTLAAVGSCLAAGYSVSEILCSLPGIQGAEGRFQIVSDYPGKQIILDYAHTPDALELVVETVKSLPHKRLILMITGIGLRDPAKRPKMAAAVEGKADHIIVSVDHPGPYNRQRIVDDVASGFHDPEAENIYKRKHREDGIHKALSLSENGDLIVITGLGFGGYQVINDQHVPYDELEVIDSYFQENRQLS
ncbi:UDP-N-acetylmuramoylalanyl-D-glutamate--2,6-diaminopimelate ligase [Marinococcus luteus]|uniref:UDP-N-acetylmuramyl-tripeptide synthetase n=1 Tax=Marinococcus luteus TaxID=1122204 RepID=A0A1H2TBY3_9BACI|nr:UDP-N-acetylmuramoyl-L-alanyl-D-glutamate--2,6-diaminopimelate ligase [Marinococcus luteus]SDW40739.1 UDP-N-acetylmuramoylalanyl-D-glutamate--2,6-diaminopimelate ligase [Marinococcus luteus]